MKKKLYKIEWVDGLKALDILCDSCSKVVQKDLSSYDIKSFKRHGEKEYNDNNYVCLICGKP